MMVLTIFWPLTGAFLTVVVVTGSGMAVAARWCPVLGIVGSAMTASGGLAWAVINNYTYNWLGVALGVVLFVLGAVNLRRVNQVMQNRGNNPASLAGKKDGGT